MNKIFKLYNWLLTSLALIEHRIFSKYRGHFISKFEILVVSKDRPFLLNSFLHSLNQKFDRTPRVKILISCDNDTAKQRYIATIQKWKQKIDIEHRFEIDNFKSSLKEILLSINSNNVMLCVDDIIFFKPIETKPVEDMLNKTDIFTLRLGINSTYSLNLNRRQTIPNSKLLDSTQFLQWSKENKKDDFNYFFSFDATIISHNLILTFAKFLVYNSPNQFESSMNYNPLLCRLLKFTKASFKEQKSVNFILNKVQTDNDNKSLQIPLEKLNDWYDNGYIITVEPGQEQKINSSHQEDKFIITKN